MRVREAQTAMMLEDYSDRVTPMYNQDSGSQILEPEIIMPIYSQNQNPVKGKSIISVEEIEPILSEQVVESTPVKSGSIDTKPVKDSEPSATTDQTKTYVGGGTTPDTPIVVKKPMTKYFVYGIVGIVGALVVYKVFFNKKTP